MRDRPTRAARHLTDRPHAHRRRLGAIVLAGAALVVGPGAGSPLVAQGPPTSAAQVRVPVSTAQVAHAQGWRLTAAALAHERSEHDEALALARAAVSAGEAAVRVARENPPADLAPDLLPALEAAQQDLTRRTADVEVQAPPLAQAAPDLAATPEQARTPHVLAAAPEPPVPGPAQVPADELADDAQEVFALALEVESVVEAAADVGTARTHALTELEEVVAGTRAVAAPVPLTDELELTPRSHAHDDPWPNGRMPRAALCAPAIAPAALLRCDAAAALDELSAAYRAAHGTDLVVTSGYRSFDEQAEVRRVKGWLAAPAGASNHGRGIAVDLAGIGGLGEFDSPTYQWLRRHAPAFGWYHPTAMQPGGAGPPEPWHWEYLADAR